MSKNEKDTDSRIGNILLSRRLLILSNSVNEKSAQKLIASLFALDCEDSKTPIDLILNSGGGSIYDGFAIYDAIRCIRAPVRIFGMGLVASMGVTLLLAVPKEQRFSLPNTSYMIHQPLIQGTLIGVVSDLEINAKEMVKLKLKMDTLIAEACGQSLEKVTKDTFRNYWMTAEEALKYGLVSEIITSLNEVRKEPEDVRYS